MELPPDDPPKAPGPRLGIVAEAGMGDYAAIKAYADVFRAAIVEKIPHGPKAEGLICHAMMDVVAELFAGAPRSVQPTFINGLMTFFEKRIEHHRRHPVNIRTILAEGMQAEEPKEPQ